MLVDDLLFSYAEASDPFFKRNLIRIVERSTGQPYLKRLYIDNKQNPREGESFFAAAVRRLELSVSYDQDKLSRIPERDSVVIVANHPYGVLDGIIISWLIEKVRRDFLVLANSVLLRAPEMKDYVLPVDFSGTEEALKTNLTSREAARKHLCKGGAVVVFPAGGVSTAPDRLGRHPAVDARWQPFVSQLIQRSQAHVVPIWFGGQNSRLFQIASHLSLALRLSLIFHEVKARIGSCVPVVIGDPIPFADLAHIRDRQSLADHLHDLTYKLAEPNWALPPTRQRRKLLHLIRKTAL